MFCPKCGKNISDDSAFCPSCGQPISVVKQAEKQFNNFSEKIDKDVDSAISDIQGKRSNQILNSNRGLISYILLSLITCGIYGFFFIYGLAKDINVACSEDGDRTPGLATYIILSLITCGIYSLYWEYKLGNRIANNAPRYGIQMSENGTSILLWRVFGILLCFLGTYVGLNILIKNANTICAAYNQKHNN